MKKKKKKRNNLIIIIFIIIIGVIGVTLLNYNKNNDTTAGYIEHEEVVYSQKIINKRFNKVENIKTIEIDSMHEEIDSIIMTNKIVEQIKSNNEYKRTLQEVLQDDDISNRDLYNIEKAIELGLVNENTKIKEYYAIVTGFKNSKNFIKFCENAFELIEKDSNL